MGKDKDTRKDKYKDTARPNFWEYNLGIGVPGELMKRYKVSRTHSAHPDGRSGKENRSYREVNRDIADKMMNDYDTRRTLEAAAMAGNKDAKQFAKKGINSGNIFSAYQTLKDLKEEYAGGGDMDGAKNRAKLTHSVVKADRKKQTARYDQKYATNSSVDEMKKKMLEQAKANKANEPTEYTESDELADAKKRLAGEGDSGNKSNDSLFKTSAPTERPTTAFSKANENVFSSDDQGTAVASYLEQYKKDLAKGAGLREDRQNNFNNAISAVAGM